MYDDSAPPVLVQTCSVSIPSGQSYPTGITLSNNLGFLTFSPVNRYGILPRLRLRPRCLEPHIYANARDSAALRKFNTRRRRTTNAEFIYRTHHLHKKKSGKFFVRVRIRSSPIFDFKYLSTYLPRYFIQQRKKHNFWKPGELSLNDIKIRPLATSLTRGLWLCVSSFCVPTTYVNKCSFKLTQGKMIQMFRGKQKHCYL